MKICKIIKRKTMSGMGSLVEQCLAISGAPENTTKIQFLQLIQTHVSTADIQRLEFLKRSRLKKWILWMDSSESVECLCDDIKKDELNISNERFIVTFDRCDESVIPESWLKGEETVARYPRQDNYASVQQSGSTRGSYSFSNTFEEECTENSLREDKLGNIKFSNLPEDIDDEFLEMYFEDTYGSDIMVKTVEFIDNRTVAILHFEKQGVTDQILQDQPFEMEGQMVSAELFISKDHEDEPKTIEVTADPGVITENSLKTIKMYFSNNSRSGGGKITECTMLPESETIQIIFQSAEEAKTVCAREDHKYKKQTLRVVLLDAELLKKRREAREKRENPKTIRITNLPAEVDRSILEVFFEDAETFGEEFHVVNVEIESDKSTAFVEFEESQAVNIIIKKQPLELEGQLISIAVKEEEQSEQLPCIVEVRGPDDLLTEKTLDTLKLYFKSTKRSGGGNVVACSILEPGVAEITFETNEVARRVAEKADHTLKSQHIDVCLKSPMLKCQSTCTDQLNKLLISGVDALDGDTLALHLEDMFEGVRVIKVEPDVEDSSAVVVELDGPEGIQTILKNHQITVEGQTLSVQLFEPPRLCTVEVKGLPNISKYLDVLKLYFKNTSRSGGGTIVKCRADSTTDVAYLTFETEEVAQRVVDKPGHILKTKPLVVSLYKPNEKLKRRPGGENEPILQNKILITNLPKTVDEQFIELFFEDFDSTSEIQVEGVKINPEDDSAIVEFRDAEAVDFILGRQPLEMKGETITVQTYHERKQEFTTVEVRGPENIESQLETLRLYFKNTKRSSGGVILYSIVDRENNVAYFTFETQEVAERVVDADHRKQGLEVTLVTEQHPTNKTSDHNICTVKVRGVEEKLTRETLTLYFESRKRSGGGPIESITDDVEDKSTIYIKFTRPEDAKDVVKKEHQVQKCTLHVSLYVPPPCYDDKVLIKGMKSTKDTLFLFLEATAQAEPNSIDYHAEEDNTVLVTMKTKLDFKKLEKACQERKLEGSQLKVSKVAVSNCIFVSNLGPEVTKDTIMYYFENTRKSGGECVEKVVMNDTSDAERSCLVFFENYKVIDTILQRQHTLGKKSLVVKVFQPAIGSPEGETRDRTFQIPHALEVKDANIHKVKFVANSRAFRETFEQELQQHYTKVIWPTEAQKNVHLHCTLTKDVQGCFKKVKTWETQAKSVFVKLMVDIALKKIDVLQEIKHKVMEFLKNISISDPSNVAILIENEQKLICIVGKKDVVDDLKKKLETEIKKIIEDAEKERQKVTEVFTSLKPIETKLMVLENVPQNLEQQFRDLKVRIIPQKNEIRLEGVISSVQSAKLAIYDKKNMYETKRIDNISSLYASLLKTESINTAIHQKLKSSGVTAVWEIDANGIEVCCTKSAFTEKAKEIIRTFLKEDTVLTESGKVPDLETDKWRSKLDAIYKKNPGKVKIAVSDNVTKVHVCATADVMTSVTEEIKSFIRSNTVVTKRISHSKQAHRLLDKHYKSDLQNISKQLEGYFVNVKVLEQYKGFEIRGVQKGVDDASALLQKLFNRIKQKSHTASKPGIAEHIRSVKGKDSIHTIETTLPCIITVADEEAYQQMTDRAHGKGLFARCNIFKTRNVNVWQGDITELEVDVIVNPSDKKLGFSGGLGRAIISKGGLTIKHECESYTRAHGDLKDDDVFMSTAGDLRAKRIAHIKSEEWKARQDMDKVLEETVFRCLFEASKLQAKSVAIPAIGCGVNRFPIEIATSSIVKALQRTFLEYQDSSVCQVYLCDMNEKNVQGFAQALSVTFGSINVEILDTCQPVDGSDDGVSKAMGAREKRFTTSGRSQSTEALQRQGNITISVIKGEIAKQTVDVIVNTTSHNLDLRNGAVSITLLKTAGQELQNELSSKYPNGLKGIDVAVSGGHKLDCKIVIHTALPNFNEKKPKESIKVLHKLMKNCLEEAQRRNYNSIAFPAIGTGSLGYPREVVAAEMFKAISKFQGNNPQSCINDVRFIVYQMDSQTVTAFESEEARIQKESQSYSGQQAQNARSLGYDVVQPGTDYSDKSASGTSSFGSITVTTKQGDITQEDTECIVNSTNEDLNLEIGKVSKTLLQMGGKELREEIENHKSEMKNHKVAVTLAPGLPCKSIIHVVADQKDLTKTVRTCLNEAENQKFTSIAFPALGAGAKTSDPGVAQEIAKSMVKAVREFAKTYPKYLLEVRFIIFQREMFQEFQTTVEATGDSKTWLGNVWQGFKNVIGISGSSSGKGDGTVDDKETFNSVTFIIMALEDNVIMKAVRKLENSLEKEMHTKVIDDPTVEQLEDHQVDELNGIATQCRVHMIMEKNRGIIKLSGIVGNVMNASDKIYSLLRDAERMELMRNIAQWFYIEVTQTGETVKPYEKDINLAIENAYRHQKDSVSFVVDAIDYILDFESMKEYPEHDKNDTATVIRRDLVKGGSVEVPPHWDDMKDGNLRVVDLTQASQEYKDVEKKFKDSAQQYKDSAGQLQDWTVTKIERVQNKTLWEQYQSKKKQLEEQNPTSTTNEWELWHGTSPDPVDSINAHGFNRSFCGKNATVYGDGVYFAIHARYSCQNTYSRPDANGIKRMYLCLVLVGEYVKGEKGMRVPPLKPSGGPNALYDSVTNDVNNPHMFIIFHDTQACPEYIIYFKE